MVSQPAEAGVEGGEAQEDHREADVGKVQVHLPCILHRSAASIPGVSVPGVGRKLRKKGTKRSFQENEKTCNTFISQQSTEVFIPFVLYPPHSIADLYTTLAGLYPYLV